MAGIGIWPDPYPSASDTGALLNVKHRAKPQFVAHRFTTPRHYGIQSLCRTLYTTDRHHRIRLPCNPITSTKNSTGLHTSVHIPRTPCNLSFPLGLCASQSRNNGSLLLSFRPARPGFSSALFSSVRRFDH